MRVKCGENGAGRNARAGETGDPIENPVASGIVRHDYHLNKIGKVDLRQPGSVNTRAFDWFSGADIMNFCSEWLDSVLFYCDHRPSFPLEALRALVKRLNYSSRPQYVYLSKDIHQTRRPIVHVTHSRGGEVRAQEAKVCATSRSSWLRRHGDVIPATGGSGATVRHPGSYRREAKTRQTSAPHLLVTGPPHNEHTTDVRSLVVNRRLEDGRMYDGRADEGRTRWPVTANQKCCRSGVCDVTGGCNGTGSGAVGHLGVEHVSRRAASATWRHLRRCQSDRAAAPPAAGARMSQGPRSRRLTRGQCDCPRLPVLAAALCWGTLVGCSRSRHPCLLPRRTGFDSRSGRSPDFHTRGSCRTMSLVGGFSRGSPPVRVRMEQRRNARTGVTGDPRENPPTSGIVRHDSYLRKSAVSRPGIEPGSPWWEASSLTFQPPRLLVLLNRDANPGAPECESGGLPPGHLASARRTTCGNRAGRSSWSRGFSRGYPVFPPPLHSGAATYLTLPSSTLKTSMLRGLRSCASKGQTVGRVGRALSRSTHGQVTSPCSHEHAQMESRLNERREAAFTIERCSATRRASASVEHIAPTTNIGFDARRQRRNFTAFHCKLPYRISDGSTAVCVAGGRRLRIDILLVAPALQSVRSVGGGHAPCTFSRVSLGPRPPADVTTPKGNTLPQARNGSRHSFQLMLKNYFPGLREMALPKMLSNRPSQHGQQLDELAVTQSGSGKSPRVSGAMLSAVRPTTFEGCVVEETGGEHDDRRGPTDLQLD
ncbi:hypothetical protein PR048_021261 [Dryococelus australis]|uniref:Uncharacterized protein n=1 Tax=Dryococelus australis TaxID=614101 RepID=A0ABQ9GXQ7_9NEOP|nr:hypothetical protein PR048_021261 [Dryococelus australis]